MWKRVPIPVEEPLFQTNAIHVLTMVNATKGGTKLQRAVGKMSSTHNEEVQKRVQRGERRWEQLGQEVKWSTAPPRASTDMQDVRRELCQKENSPLIENRDCVREHLTGKKKVFFRALPE